MQTEIRSPFLDAARGGCPTRRPVWILRQAGRYLPEYREIRERLSFLELCHSPESAAEVTLQPVDRFDLDAAILFTDLLIPLIPMGMALRYEPGPVLERTVGSIEDVRALRVPAPEADLAPMLATVELVRKRLSQEKALIGFVGAPFTMACYMIEGRGSKAWDKTRSMMHRDPETFTALLDRIEECLTPLVRALVAHGCDAVQIFDSWASVLGAEDYAKFCAGRTDGLLRTARDAGAVAINYVNGAGQHLESIARSCAHVAAVDWRRSLETVRAATPDHLTLQGNLDPTALFASEETLRARVRSVCEAAGDRPHIFNLGHGILPDTDPRAVEILVDELRSLDRE